MRIYFVTLCFTLALVVLTQAKLRIAGLPGFPGKKGLTAPKGVPRTQRTMKYCKVGSKITTFLKQFRSIGIPKGRDGLRGIQKRSAGNNWIYNCLHAGLNLKHHIFEVPTFRCCKKCEFPGFSRCMRSYRIRAVAQTRCNSEALRCIARCINKRMKKCGTAGQTRARVFYRSGSQKCPMKRKKVGGSYCLERSCIYVRKAKVIF